uniref:Uncharacterized protein n=1 Tax=Mus spicilegus TaxID=10103 RepID=A0A8C6I3N9_MUSSI
MAAVLTTLSRTGADRPPSILDNTGPARREVRAWRSGAGRGAGPTPPKWGWSTELLGLRRPLTSMGGANFESVLREFEMRKGFSPNKCNSLRSLYFWSVILFSLSKQDLETVA